jgi:hypothetical protein
VTFTRIINDSFTVKICVLFYPGRDKNEGMMAPPNPRTTAEEVERPTRPTDGPPDSAGRTDSATPGDTDQQDRLPKDVIFGLLSNERRRRVLTYLEETGGDATLSDIAEEIASNENDKSVTALSSGERKRVYVCLYQSHLPKMDDANVIEYNQPRGTVELRPEASQLLSYLDLDPGGPSRRESGLWDLLPTTLGTVGRRLVQ